MPVASLEEAVDILTKAVQEDLDVDELLEVHNELFPDAPYTEEKAYEDYVPLVERIGDHINGPLEIDDLVDLWNLILPGDRDVWYDETDQKFHYNEEEESSSSLSTE